MTLLSVENGLHCNFPNVWQASAVHNIGVPCCKLVTLQLRAQTNPLAASSRMTCLKWSLLTSGKIGRHVRFASNSPGLKEQNGASSVSVITQTWCFKMDPEYDQDLFLKLPSWSMLYWCSLSGSQHNCPTQWQSRCMTSTNLDCNCDMLDLVCSLYSQRRIKRHTQVGWPMHVYKQGQARKLAYKQTKVIAPQHADISMLETLLNWNIHESIKISWTTHWLWL